MKPDPYKAKASRAWKRKHKTQVQVDRQQDVLEQDLSVEDGVESDHDDYDTQMLLDLKNKMILNDEKRDSGEIQNLKFTIQLKTNERQENKSFKGFHDQIFVKDMPIKGTLSCSPDVPSSKELKTQHLQEWLDDILG